MHLAPLFVAGSFLSSGAIIGSALWSTSPMRHQFEHYSSGQWTSAAGVLLPLVAICGWPWLLAFVRAFKQQSRRSAAVFALVGLGLAALFYSPISSAPAERIGIYVIILVLLAWVAYPLSVVVAGR